MEPQVTYSGHLLFLPFPIWSHLRPLCAFSAKVIQERRDVAITFLMLGDRRKQIEREISRCLPDSTDEFGATGNIRIVNIYDDPNINLMAMFRLIVQAFPDYYDNLINCKPVQCLETKTKFEAIRRPNSIILGSMFHEILQKIHSVTGKGIPVLAWATTYAPITIRTMGPEEIGGFGDGEAKAHAQVEATGGKLDEVLYELYHKQDGNVIRMPGLPPMYDYEWFPQVPPPELHQNHRVISSYIFARECDGFLSVSSAAYEPESLAAMRSWLAETNCPVYAVGPLLPPSFGDAAGLSFVAKQKEIDSSKNGGEFQTFLDETLKGHGKRSLIYVSFGSFLWPEKSEYVWVLIDILLDLNFPFIFSHASSKAIVPPEYAKKVKQSGIGLLSTWSPQQTILNHPVTGWFLTHCGQNSVTESLGQGIPMISWPLFADQPANAAHLTLNLDVAFQLVEVRTGPGLKPLLRGARPTGTIEAFTAEARSVFERARGPEGERKRGNAEAMRYKWKKAWEEGGDALNNLRNFLTDYCSGN